MIGNITNLINMELNELIDNLIKSDLINNKELGVTLMNSSELSDEKREEYVDNWVKDYLNDPSKYWSEENKNLVAIWLELYRNRKDKLKGRIVKL